MVWRSCFYKSVLLANMKHSVWVGVQQPIKITNPLEICEVFHRKFFSKMQLTWNFYCRPQTNLLRSQLLQATRNDWLTEAVPKITRITKLLSRRVCISAMSKAWAQLKTQLVCEWESIYISFNNKLQLQHSDPVEGLRRFKFIGCAANWPQRLQTTEFWQHALYRPRRGWLLPSREREPGINSAGRGPQCSTSCAAADWPGNPWSNSAKTAVWKPTAFATVSNTQRWPCCGFRFFRILAAA